MKRFLFLAVTLAVLTSAALGAGKQSETPLPPVPTAQAITDSSPMPMPPADDDNPSSRRTIRNKAESLLPWRTEQAPAPSCCATPAATAFKPSCTTPAATALKPSCSTPVTAFKAQAPTCAAAQAPSCSAAQETCDVRAPVICVPCETRRIAPLSFLVKELVRKPIYGIQKAKTEAEAHRLAVRECRLGKESEELAGQAYVLAHKAASTCPCDACAKQALCRQEVRYANEANRHALKVAELEAKQAENDAKSAALRAKHLQLFNN